MDNLPDIEFNIEEDMQCSTVPDDVNDSIFIILNIIFGFMDKNIKTFSSKNDHFGMSA